jgi:hypothetical protein
MGDIADFLLFMLGVSVVFVLACYVVGCAVRAAWRGLRRVWAEVADCIRCHDERKDW